MKAKTKPIVCWHFAGTTLSNGEPLPKKGGTLKYKGDVVPCESGLHGSERAIDALNYAPGCMVARVELSGVVVAHGEPLDKYAASKRKTLTKYLDSRKVLVAWSRACALTALRVHAAEALRNAGLVEHADKLAGLADDCQLSAAIRSASRAADASRATSRAASRATDASWAASWAADASRAAIRAADASWAASKAASWAADASSAASWAADASRAASNKDLEKRLLELFK